MPIEPVWYHDAFSRFCLITSVLVALVPATSSAQGPSSPVQILLQLGHQNAVHGVAITSDGLRIVSGSSDKTIKLWSAESGRELHTFSGHKEGVDCIAVSSDGLRIVSGSADKTIKLWNAESGRELRTFSGHTQAITSVALSPDGRQIISGSWDGSVRLWDVDSGRERRRFGESGRGVHSLAYSSDGRRIVTGYGDGAIKIWDVESGREFRSLRNHKELVGSVAFSPDGRGIVSGSWDKTIKLWDVDTGRELRSFAGHAGWVNSVSYSPDGQLIVSGSSDNTVKIWEIESGREIRSYLGHDGPVWSVAFLTDGRSIISGSNDNTIKIWGLENAREIRSYAGAMSVWSVAFSPDGSRIVSGAGKAITLWDVASGREFRAFGGHTSTAFSVAFAPDGRRIVSGGGPDKTFKIWDADRGLQLLLLSGHNGWAYSAAFSPDGHRVVTASADKTLKIWDTDNGRELRGFKGHTDWVESVAFSPIGRRFASGSRDGSIRLWDADTGRELNRFKGHPGGVTCLAFSADGRRIVSGGYDKTVRLWDADSGRQISSFESASYVSSVAFSPDGRQIASGDNVVVVWDSDSGRELRRLTGHAERIFSVKFSPDGRRIASGGGDARIWDAQSGALLGSKVSFPGGEWIFFTPEGFFDASSPNAAQNMNLVRGPEVSSIDQVYNALYRPDLVREKLAGDPDGKVKAAAAKLDLDKVMASGSSPKVVITSPVAGASSVTDEISVEASVSDQGGGIGKVEWRVNGVTSGIETRGLERIEAVASSGRSLTVKRTLALERGDNRIEVLAYNNKDLIASEPASVTVRWDVEKTATPPKLYVMAVGVNDYYDSRLRLSYAVPDATAIAEGFRKAGAGLYAAVDITTVLDTDVTIANLDKVFTEVGKKAQARDVFVFFLAGHGKTKNGKYYFLPRDFRYEDEDSIEKAGMDQDKFQAWFAKIPARKSILLYDTCESGSLTGTKARGSDIDERLGALNRMTRATGRTFLTATTDDAPALEGYRGHGVFTYALLDALEHADVNKNGLIEVSELADYIDEKVPDFSFEAFKLRQIPQRNIVGSNFALTNKTTIFSTNNAAPLILGRGSKSSPAAAPASSASTPTKPTHVVITFAPIEVYTIASDTGAPIQRLPSGTLVTVIKSLGGWTLIAKDGNTAGYVAQAGLAPLQ